MAPTATAATPTQEDGTIAGPSTVKVKTEDEALSTVPLIKRRWAPTRYLTEAPHPPIIDHRLEEEAAAHQAAQEAGYEGRRVRKFLQRRTVDYNESFQRWKLQRSTLTCPRNDRIVWPGANHVVELLPSAAYRSSAQAVTTNLVHSCVNKIRNPVNVVRWTPEGRRLLTGSASGEFTLWNGLTFNFETILQAHDSAIRAIQYTKSGAWILSGDQGGQVKYYQSNMNNLQLINAHRESVRGISLSPDDSRFVTASDDGTMKMWAFEEAREESTLKGHGWDVKCVDWHPYMGLIVSGSKDNLVKFWDPRSTATLATYHGHKGTVQAVQWSNDGNLVASASRDQVIKLYDIRKMSESHTLKGHPSDVSSLHWHPSHSDLLVSGGSDGSILYWSLEASDPSVPVHSSLNAHDGNIWTVQWHPLGHLLASASNDHSTRFWQRARPEDGRLGDNADAQQASKQQRFNKAARGGGEDWDDDAGFIPGLGAGAKPRVNGNTAMSSSGQANARSNAFNDDFLPPGLGGQPSMNRGGPPPMPPMQNFAGAPARPPQMPLRNGVGMNTVGQQMGGLPPQQQQFANGQYAPSPGYSNGQGWPQQQHQQQQGGNYGR